MFKDIIAPMQAWLLSQGKCVGCGKKLPKEEEVKGTQVTCNCGRIYVYDSQSGRYRRATLNEIK